MEIRMLKQSEFDEAVKLSDAIFRDSEQASMKDGFFDLYTETAHSFGAFADGRLISFMGLLPSVVRIGDAALSVFSLGSVCTLPDYRGKGTAGQILDTIKTHIDEADASLMLISGSRGLYRRAGCHLFGKVTRYSLEPGNPALTALPQRSNTVFRRAVRKDFPMLSRLASARSVRFEHSVTDLSRLILSEAYAKCVKLRHQVYAAELNGRIAAFVVVAVAIDGLQPKHIPFVVEWAGDAAIMPQMLAYIVKEENLSALTVPVPWHEHELLEALSVLPSNEEKNLGTVYVANANRLLDQLSPYLHERGFTPKDLRFEPQPSGMVRLHAANHSAELTSEQLVSLLFDPGSLPDVLPAPLQKAVESLLPIPFPYAGGLNYI